MFLKLNLLLLLAVTTMFVPVTSNSHRKVFPKSKKIIGWAVQKTSTIQIKGATNLNSFGCDVINSVQPDTIFCTPANVGSRPITLTGDLQVVVSKFDCHNKMMTHDLRQTLKADEYPVLVIRFLSLERAPEISTTKDQLKGWVEIGLAGCVKKFEVDYSFTSTASAFIQLNGKRTFNFSDFNLIPPKKFGGIVKVKDQLNVNFTLLLNPVE